MALFYNWRGCYRLQVISSVLQLKHLNIQMQINLYEPRREKCFFGVHAPDSPACVHVDTETNNSLLRTSDGGNGNHSVSLPIILIKIKVDQMLPSSYIRSLLVSIL